MEEKGRSNGKRVPREAAVIGTNMRRLRLAAGLSQRDVAQALGITYQQVQKYETGQNRFPAEKLFYLGNFYGVPSESFFVGLPGAAAGYDLSPLLRISRVSDTALRRKIRDVVEILVS